MSVSVTWETSAAERRLVFPCDGLLSHADAQLYRGITINSSPEIVFRWLCQLRVAPYSYDWIDNGGRRSPQQLIPGLETLKVGQDVMTIFTLASFTFNQHLTIRLTSRRAKSLFGDIAVSYMIVPTLENEVIDRAPVVAPACRLLVKLDVQYPQTLPGRFLRRLLPWADLIMMRKQLLNLKRLAEGR